MRETAWAQKRRSSLSLGPQPDNDTEAPYSHPAPIRHFYRFNRAVEHSCQAGQYCHWMGTVGWRVASGARLPRGQRVPGTLAVGFSIPRAADILARHGSGGARLTRG